MTTSVQTLYLTAGAEDRYTRFDFDTGPGRGCAHFPQYDGAAPREALL